LTERDAGVAKAIEDSGAPIDQADAKTAVDKLKKSDAIEQPDQNQNMALSVGVEFSSLENDKSIPKSSSSDFTISDQKHHMKTPDTKTSDMKTPDMKTSDMKTSDTKTSDTKTSDTKTSGKPRAATIRQTPNHAPVKQASLENKNTSACSESQSCSSKVSPLLGVGF
jgi:hypothetical protein